MNTVFTARLLILPFVPVVWMISYWAASHVDRNARMSIKWWTPVIVWLVTPITALVAQLSLFRFLTHVGRITDPFVFAVLIIQGVGILAIAFYVWSGR